MYDRFHEELAIGERGRYGPVEVTEQMVTAFADLTGDHHRLHVDAEFAAQSRFGRRIAHGFLVLSLSAGLFPMRADTVLAFYGMDRVRFLRPTLLGDLLWAQLTVVDIEPRGADAVVTTSLEMVNGRDAVVAVAQLRILVASRTSAPVLGTAGVGTP